MQSRRSMTLSVISSWAGGNPSQPVRVTGGIIFLAVAVDGLRTRILDTLNRRTIRPVEAG